MSVYLIASVETEGHRIGPPNADHPIRFYSNGMIEDDFLGGRRARWLTFKEVMEVEALACSAHLPEIDVWSWLWPRSDDAKPAT